MASDIGELFDELDMEFWFDTEGHSHKMSHGSSGMQINAKSCPFCGNSNWKVYLNAESGAGNCFVCDERFSKSKFIKASIDGSWKETIEHTKVILRDQGWKPKRTITVATTEDKVKLPTSFALPTVENQNLVYLENRGVTKELAKYFKLRFCMSGWWNFTKDDGERGGQFFEDRILIPVYDLDGDLKTFQGRDVTGGAERKYLFPSGLPGTGKYLYNGMNAMRSKRVVVNEGAFDVIGTKIALDRDPELRDVTPVGTFGKHLSYGSVDGDDQLGRFIELKNNGLIEATIMWDGEKSALNAALKSASKLYGIGIKVKVALLPLGKDPNEVTGEVLRECFYKAKPYSKMMATKLLLRNPYK